MIWKCKKVLASCFEGDVIISKKMLWLVAACCLFAGMVYGFLKAPLTHGVTIASNNGNQSGCVYGNTDEDEEDA